MRYSLGDRFLDPFREALDIGRGSDIPVHITHFYHRTTSAGGASRMLDLVEDARESGLDVTFDSYPYNLSSTRLLILLPQWAHDGGPERLTEVLRDPDACASGSGGTWARARARGATCGSPTSASPPTTDSRGAPSCRSPTCSTSDPVDVVCDLLVDEDLEISYVSPAATSPRCRSS